MRKSVLAISVALAFGGVSIAHATDSELVERVDGNYDRSKKNHDRIDMVKAKAVKNHDRIDMVKGKIEHTDGRVDKLKGEVKANETFITEVETSVTVNSETNVDQDVRISQNARTVSNYHTAMQQGFQSHQSQLSNHEQRITGLESDVHTLRNDVDQLKGGVALGIAVGTLQYDLSDTSSTQMAVSTGYYSDHSAIAVGMGTPLSESAFFNANVSATNDGQVGAGAGLTFKFR